MTLVIHPDPQEPAGGYAFLELPGGTLGEGPVKVAVMELYGNRWLGTGGDSAGQDNGDGNWQGERHDFGPYPVHAHDGADWVRIGPEIVNNIDEYTPLRVDVAGQVSDVSWPDDVPPRAGAAVLGGLQSTERPKPTDPGGELVGKATEPEPDPEPAAPPEPPEMPAPPDPTPQPDPEPPAKPMRGMWQPLILLLFMIAMSAALWYVMSRDDPPVKMTEETCTATALAALDGFTTIEQAIRACGDKVSPDTVLKLVEDASAANDPDALLLFGTLYDGAETDARIETVIGLSFDHDAPLAAAYYSRAAQAGSDVARTRLNVTCAQLASSDETLAKGAYDDFCG